LLRIRTNIEGFCNTDLGGRLFRCFSQTKIENLGMATLGDEDVRGLDVPVDNAFGMCRIESIGDVDGNAEQLFQCKRTAADQRV
jgi:hypothetical protein